MLACNVALKQIKDEYTMAQGTLVLDKNMSRKHKSSQRAENAGTSNCW